MQNSIFSRARQLTELSKAGAFMQMQLLILLSVGYLSPWSLVYHGVQAKPSGACAISGLRSSFEGQAWTSQQRYQGENEDGETALCKNRIQQTKVIQCQ